MVQGLGPYARVLELLQIVRGVLEFVAIEKRSDSYDKVVYIVPGGSCGHLCGFYENGEPCMLYGDWREWPRVPFDREGAGR